MIRIRRRAKDEEAPFFWRVAYVYGLKDSHQTSPKAPLGTYKYEKCIAELLGRLTHPDGLQIHIARCNLERGSKDAEFDKWHFVNLSNFGCFV